MTGVYNIPAGRSFVDSLAAGVMERYSHDLSKAVILLPNRQDCLHLRDAFLRQTGGKPLVLPRISTIDDMDEESIFHPIMVAAGQNTAVDIPTAISPLTRKMLLARQIKSWYRAQGEHIASDKSLMVARSLADFLDEAQREGCDFSNIAQIVPDKFSDNWQKNLDFLEIITIHWPDILKKRNLIDPVERRNRLIDILRDFWKHNPPTYPVIVAGVTSSTPSIARLLRVIATMDSGMVVLPGIDLAADKNYWRAVDPVHSQYALKNLLICMGVERDDVKPWISEKKTCEDRGRDWLVRELMRPASLTGEWSNIAPAHAVDMQNLTRIDCADQNEEAAVIALLLKEVLHTPEKNVALITADSDLAMRVSVAMGRYNVRVDDSTSSPLSSAPPLVLMQFVVNMASAKNSVVPLLELLRHPLCCAGISALKCRDMSRFLEMRYLRGMRSDGGLASILEATADDSELHDWIRGIYSSCRGFIDIFSESRTSFSRMLDAHIACSEWLSCENGDSSALSLWAGAGGSALSGQLRNMRQVADIIGDINPTEYARIFSELISTETYRSDNNPHPRISILKPNEAMFVHHGRVILGGLNEGSWPDAGKADPWMSREMREKFGLPPSAVATGMAAHGFTSLLHADEVFLTRYFFHFTSKLVFALEMPVY